MTLDELSAAWNDLRNAALGRGLAPNVPPALAANVDRQYKAWRKALIHMPAAADMLASAYTRDWVSKYRRLLARVQKAGAGPQNVLPTTPFELSTDALTVFSRNVAIGLGVAGAAMVLYFVATRRSQRVDL